MLKDKCLSFSILCFSISIVISAAIIANAMRTNGESISGSLSSISGGINNIAHTLNNNSNNNAIYTRNTYNLSAAASYLGINEYRLKELVSNKDSGIPYIKISDQEYIFSKNALDKWLETVRFEIK